MIRHATAAFIPVDLLPVPVIEPSFQAFLVFLAGTARLPAPHPESALIPAVHLPPVATPANVKHLPASRTLANQIVPSHLGHAPHDSTAV